MIFIIQIHHYTLDQLHWFYLPSIPIQKSKKEGTKNTEVTRKFNYKNYRPRGSSIYRCMKQVVDTKPISVTS